MKLTCPSQNRLREYLEGSVNETDSEKILDHIEGCSSCDHVLATMESEQNDVMNEVCEFVRTESLLQEPEFEQLRNTAGFSQTDAPTLPDVDEHPEAGKRLRDYRLVKKIGEGGMGTVYHAFHVHLAKHVALKILPSDKLQSKQSVARFRQEMRAVGQVNHPNVVGASDAGTIDGQHFLVMELVQGADLARIIHDRGPLNVADACEIVRQAAIGLQHAHDNGLVHRDVKPSNVMLALDGSVKLLDLGLAGLNNTEFESTANVVVTDRLTSVGQIMGTLDYMAPEQITASPQVDGKADIYALGATLFQLLTGRTPCGDRSEGTPERIEAVLHNPPLDIATLRNDVPEELCALLLKMLAKKPEDRPQAAIDVASELTRFASDADLDALAEACRTSLDMPSADVDVTDDVSFVVSRTAQPQDDVNSRRPLTAVALACFFLVLLVAAVVYYIQTDNGVIRVRVMDESLAVTITGQMVEMKDGDKQLTIRAGHHKLEVSHRDSDFKFLTNQFEVKRNGETAFEVALIPGKVVVTQEGEPFKTMPLPKDGRPIETDSSHKAVETSDELAKRIENMPGRKSGFLIWPDGTFRVLYSDSAMRYVSLSDTEVIIDDPPTDSRDNRHFKIEGLQGKDVVEIAMSPDGRFVAYSTKSKSVLFDAETAKPVMTLHEGEQPAHFIQFSPSGRYLLLGIGNKGRMFEVPRPGMSASGRSWLVGHNEPITHAQFDREESQILTGSKDQSVIIWRNNLEGKKIQTLKHQGRLTTVRFSPGEKSILTASTNSQTGKHSVEVWDAAQGELQRRIEHASAASAIFTKDGRQVVSVSKDTITWWNASDGTELKSFHLAGIDHTDAYFAEDRLHLVVVFQDQAVVFDLIEATPIRKLTTFAHRLRTEGVPKNAEDDDGKYVDAVPVSGQFSTDMRPGYRQFYMLSDKGVWNMWSVARAKVHKRKTSDSTPQPRAGKVAVAKGNPQPANVPLEPSVIFNSAPFRFGDRINSLEYSPDGKRLLSAGGQWGAALWDAETGKLIRHFSTNEWRAWTTADFSPNGRLVAIAGTSQKPVPIWDVETGELVRVIEQGAKAVRFAPDGKSVFTEFFYTLTRFDVATGENMPKFAKFKEGNWMFATPRKGTLVAGTAADKLHVWDWKSGEQVASATDVRGGHHNARDVVFTPDGNSLVAFGKRYSVELRDARTLKVKRVFELKGDPLCLNVSADGSTLAVGVLWGWVHVFDLNTGKEIRAWQVPRSEVDGLSAVALTPDGHKLATGLGYSATVQIWDAETGKELLRSEPEKPTTFGDVLKTGSGKSGHDSAARAELGKKLSALAKTERNDVTVEATALSDDGRYGVVTLRDVRVLVYDLENSKYLRTLPKTQSYVSSLKYHVALSPDGRLLAAGRGEKVSLRNVLTGKEVDAPDVEVDVSGLAFSPVDETLAVVGEREVLLWSVKHEHVRRVIVDQEHGVQSIAFSPDGRTLATGSHDFADVVVLWDIASGREIRQLRGARGGAASLAFSHDGSKLYAGTGSSLIVGWNLGQQAEGSKESTATK